MKRFLVYFKPNFYGLNVESNVLINAIDEADAINEVLHVSGIGYRDGKTIFPTVVTRVEER